MMYFYYTAMVLLACVSSVYSVLGYRLLRQHLRNLNATANKTVSVLEKIEEKSE